MDKLSDLPELAASLTNGEWAMPGVVALVYLIMYPDSVFIVIDSGTELSEGHIR